MFGFLSKSWFDIDRDELEVVLVVAVCAWLAEFEFAAFSETAILGSDAECAAGGWGFSEKKNQNSEHHSIVLPKAY